MVFLLFDQMHGEIVGFVQRRVGLSAGPATWEFERRHWRDGRKPGYGNASIIDKHSWEFTLDLF
jgi:hypothetical protein